MNDTDPEIERVWIRMLREAGPERRGRLASQLSNQVRWRAMEAIGRAHPALSERERNLLFVKVHYGAELEARVRAYLERETP
jgi:hypothetical protein